MKKTYTEQFKEAYNDRLKKQEEYIENNNLRDKFIFSAEHPKYFEIDHIWDEKRKELDAPLLKLAYYKVGDIVFFSKTNTFHRSFNIDNKPHLLIDKAFLSHIILDENYENNCLERLKNTNFLYEKILTRGVVDYIQTSDAGSGEILYGLKNVVPEPPESNPWVMERDIITISTNFEFFK